MRAVFLALAASLRVSLRSRAALQLEVLALRHQLAVYQRRHQRVRTEVVDRLLWAWLSRTWSGWRNVLVFVQPSTVIAWQRRRFRDLSFATMPFALTSLTVLLEPGSLARPCFVL